MRLVDTDIMPNDMQTITVQGNTILDFSPDGCYAYCLNVIYTSNLIKRGIAGYHPIATIYFNSNMSMELHDCIHKNILFEFNGKECDIDNCVREGSYIVCQKGNGMPYLQKGDLDRQSQRLSEYCAKKKIMVSHIIKDVGSGMNDNRSGFVKLTNLIIGGKVNMLVVEHKDRLTRFQFNFIKKMFESYGCKVVVVEGEDVSSEEELCQDIMSLVASFSGKYYGRRSAERRKKNSENKI